MPKKVARLLPESASHVIDENCKKRMAARKQLANSSAIIRVVSNLVDKKLLISTDKVLSMRGQEEIRLNIIGLLEGMKELASVTSVDKKGGGAHQLPKKQAYHNSQPVAVLKSSRFNRYVKAKVELQGYWFVTSEMSRLATRNTSLQHKMMITKDSDRIKKDVHNSGQKFEQLENTSWKSANDLPKQQHSDGNGKTLELK